MIKIIIRRTLTGYQAYAHENENTHSGHEGGTPSEALGALIAQHPKLFGVGMIDQYPKAVNRTSTDEGGDEFVN